MREKCVWEVGARTEVEWAKQVRSPSPGGWSSPTGNGDGRRRLGLVFAVMARLAHVWLKI